MDYVEVGKPIKTRWLLLRGLDSKILDKEIVIQLTITISSKICPYFHWEMSMAGTVSSTTLLQCLKLHCSEAQGAGLS